jgi:hypothetical protein
MVSFTIEMCFLGKGIRQIIVALSYKEIVDVGLDFFVLLLLNVSSPFFNSKFRFLFGASNSLAVL